MQPSFSEPGIAAAASAILNARGGRMGVLLVRNVLEFVPQQIKEQAIEDAKAAVDAYLTVVKGNGERTEKVCTRTAGHSGPCNGLPRAICIDYHDNLENAFNGGRDR